MLYVLVQVYWCSSYAYLKMQQGILKISVHIHQATRRHIPEESNFTATVEKTSVYVEWLPVRQWRKRFVFKGKSATFKNPEEEDKINTLRTWSFKLFKRPFPGFLTILTL